MTPCAERLCVAAAVLAGTLALPCLGRADLPAMLACRMSALAPLTSATLERVVWPVRAPHAGRPRRA